MAIKPINYYQNDPKWGSRDYSAAGESKTISAAGCGPTSAAMIIQTLRPDLRITPVETARWSKEHGYKIKNQGTAYNYFKAQMAAYGLVCSQLNSTNVYHNPNADIHSKVAKKVKSGNFIIAVMGPGNWTRAGHYVVLWKMDDSGNVYINDPASSAANRVKNTWNKFKNEVKYYWEVSYGKSCTSDVTGRLYKHKDTLRGSYAKLPAKSALYLVKDCKDGWSITTNSNDVGYVKNTLLPDGMKLSTYPVKKIVLKAALRLKNNKLSRKLESVPVGSTVKVITKRKNWTNVIFKNKSGKSTRGYIATKKIKW